MKSFSAVVERCPDTGLYVGYGPGFAGARSQGVSLDELRRSLEQVIAMVLEGGEPTLEAQFAGTQTIQAGSTMGNRKAGRGPEEGFSQRAGRGGG